MTNTEKLIKMYNDCDEKLYDFLTTDTFDEVYEELSKNLTSKNYEILCFLDTQYEFYH